MIPQLAGDQERKTGWLQKIVQNFFKILSYFGQYGQQ